MSLDEKISTCCIKYHIQYMSHRACVHASSTETAHCAMDQARNMCVLMKNTLK